MKEEVSYNQSFDVLTTFHLPLFQNHGLQKNINHRLDTSRNENMRAYEYL